MKRAIVAAGVLLALTGCGEPHVEQRVSFAGIAEHRLDDYDLEPTTYVSTRHDQWCTSGPDYECVPFETIDLARVEFDR